jgi:hypothetical protein
MPQAAPSLESPGAGRPSTGTLAPSSSARYGRERLVDVPREEAIPGLKSRRRLSWRTLLFALPVLALAGVLLLWLLWSGAPSLHASVVVDQQGSEHLKLLCPECPNGTRVALNGREAEFRDNAAQLALARPLRVGDNELSLTVFRPGGSSSEVSIVVPIEYRVRSDLSALDSDPPRLKIVIEARPGTRAQVDGTALSVPASGRAEHSIELSRELTAPNAVVARLERKLLYTIASAGRTEERGELIVLVPVVPLVIEVPGPDVITDRADFMLTGRTHRGATVTVGGRSIAVDTGGRFAQLMNVSHVGETTITLRASSSGFAPRLVKLKVKRVQDLAEEAEQLTRGAITSYDELPRNPEKHQGARVALEGKVDEARVENHTTVLLVELKRDCKEEPCLFRVVHGAALGVTKGKTVKVYGRYAGTVEGLRPGKPLPDIRSDIVLTGR